MDLALLGKAAAQGVVEGLTEFIPVSSTGHLILFGDLIDFVGDKAKVFEVFIQLGAILAVVFLYFDYFRGLIVPRRGAAAGTGFTGIPGMWKLFLTCVPALIAGFVLHDVIKEKLFNPTTVAAGLAVGGAIMIWIESTNRRPSVTAVDQITWKQCLLLGCFQCLALWPGMSRSGSTIIGALVLGFERTVAAEFSFLMAVPIMFAAVAFDMHKSARFLEAADALPFGCGFLISLVTAVFAIKFFMKIVQRYTLKGFGIYRLVLAALVLAFM